MQINNAGQEYLSSPITMEEIKTTLFSIDDSNSPGPDGFSAKFYKLHLDDQQEDMYIYYTVNLRMCFNSYFLYSD